LFVDIAAAAAAAAFQLSFESTSLMSFCTMKSIWLFNNKATMGQML